VWSKERKTAFEKVAVEAQALRRVTVRDRRRDDRESGPFVERAFSPLYSKRMRPGLSYGATLGASTFHATNKK
jgi:hypothetical protein